MVFKFTPELWSAKDLFCSDLTKPSSISQRHGNKLIFQQIPKTHFAGGRALYLRQQQF